MRVEHCLDRDARCFFTHDGMQLARRAVLDEVQFCGRIARHLGGCFQQPLPQVGGSGRCVSLILYPIAAVDEQHIGAIAFLVHGFARLAGYVDAVHSGLYSQ
jgi:hypothetical protein